jgi:hypothetical protein
MNYISLKSVLSKIPNSLFNDAEESEFLDWFVDGLHLLPYTLQYQTKVEFFEIISGKVALPKYIKKINGLYYQESKISDDCFDDVEQVTEQTEEPSDINPAICKPLITYKMFLESEAFTRNFKLLKYVGQDQSLLCTNCPNKHCNSPETFIITPQKIMHLSLREGWLCINFETPICNEDGDLLIPDNQNLIEFLVAFAICKHWENRQFTKEESASNFYQNYLQKSEILLRKAQGDHLLRSVNINNIVDIQGMLSRIITLPRQLQHDRYRI